MSRGSGIVNGRDLASLRPKCSLGRARDTGADQLRENEWAGDVPDVLDGGIIDWSELERGLAKVSCQLASSKRLMYSIEGQSGILMHF